ncbi:hypothetical protein RHECNPAF_4460057 [Rhizobium etli CNPAF512]|nr:hypothetical protein RHECNPAF_4460057 [Rhizobium etli CNPAF512]
MSLVIITTARMMPIRTRTASHQGRSSFSCRRDGCGAICDRSGLFAHLVVEEPLLVQRIKGTVRFESGDGGIDGSDEIGALREDKAEILGAERFADHFQPTIRGIDVALGSDAVGQYEVDVAGLQRLHGCAEGFEELDARVLFVAIEDFIDGGIKRRGAGLGANQAVVEGGKALGVGEALLVAAHQHELLRTHIGIGEVDLLFAVVLDGDAGHADVVLAVGNRLDHRVPAGVLVFDFEVQPLGDLVHRIIFPADRLAGFRIDELQRRIGILGDNDDALAAEIGQLGSRYGQWRKRKSGEARKNGAAKQHGVAPKLTAKIVTEDRFEARPPAARVRKKEKRRSEDRLSRNRIFADLILLPFPRLLLLQRRPWLRQLLPLPFRRRAPERRQPFQLRCVPFPRQRRRVRRR